MAQENDKNELRVEDRRSFDKDGNPIRRDEAQEQPRDTPGRDQVTTEPRQSGESPVQIDFSSLIFLYLQAALVHLGELEDPGQTKAEVNLDAARQMIDIIDLLRVKTRGNLTPQEEQHIEKALFDLRLLYVQKAKKA